MMRINLTKNDWNLRAKHNVDMVPRPDAYRTWFQDIRF
jgi:hypothetical protein